MNRDKVALGHRHAIKCTNKGMLMYIAYLCPNLVSVHLYAIPVLHFKFHLLHVQIPCITPVRHSPQPLRASVAIYARLVSCMKLIAF